MKKCLRVLRILFIVVVVWLPIGVMLMARGLPDDSNVVKEYDIYTLDDMGELAARLGSPMTYNRYGNILMLEDFERGLNAWSITLAGVGAEVVITPDRVYGGKLACYLDSGIGAAPEAQIDKLFPPVSKQRVGLQMAFSVGFNAVELRFAITRGDGARTHQFNVKYEHTTGKLYYREGFAVWTHFATPGTLYDGANNYHHAKLVVDLATDEFVTFYLDNVAYSMAEDTPYTFGAVVSPFTGAMFTVKGAALLSGDVWVDNVFVTTNER